MRSKVSQRGEIKVLVGVGWFILWALALIGCSHRESKLPSPVYKEIRQAIYEETMLFRPLDVVLVIDQSGSMVRTTDPSGLRMDAAMTFTDFLCSWASERQDYRLGVVHFGTQAPSEKSVPLVNVREKRDELKRHLAEMKLEFARRHLGNTMFINAFREAKRLLQEGNAFEASRQPAIVVLTDGRPDDGTGGPLQPYFQAIEGYVSQELPHVPIYIVAVDQRNVYWPSNKPYWEKICTPKRTFKISSVAEAEQVYLTIIADLLGLEWKEVETQKVNLPPYLERVSFTLLKLDPKVRLKILDPDGKEINRKTPNISYRTDESGGRYEIYSIPDPKPGIWTVEPVVPSGERFLGKVTVLMHSLFIATIIHSPKNPHPLKMPMRLEIEFQRRDGKPVQENPRYPLAIYAKVWSPKASQPQEVSFHREGPIFVGEPEIATDVEGEYVVDIMVKGGGEPIFRHQEKIAVKPLPYLKIGDPTVPWHQPVNVQAYLMLAGKRQKVSQVFHPTESAHSIGVFRVLRGDEQKEVSVGYLEAQEEPTGTVLRCVLPPVNTYKETILLIVSDLFHLRWKNVFRLKPQRTVDRLELRLIGRLANGEEYRSQVFKIAYERVNLFGLVFPWTVLLLVTVLALRWWWVVGTSWSRPFGELVLQNQGNILLGRGRYKKRVLTIGSQGDIRIRGDNVRPIEGRIFVKKRRRLGERGWERVCVFQPARPKSNPGKFSRYFFSVTWLGILTMAVMVAIIENHPWALNAWVISLVLAVSFGVFGWGVKKMEEANAFHGESIMTPGWSYTVGSTLIQYR